MKKLLLAFSCLCLQQTIHAQYYLTHHEDTVRWFAGKWTDPKTFKTDSTLKMMRIRLPLQVTNMDKVIVNKRYDAKEINPAEADAIVYAYLTIRIEHSPLKD